MITFCGMITFEDDQFHEDHQRIRPDELIRFESSIADNSVVRWEALRILLKLHIGVLDEFQHVKYIR
jgi:hypothetical protein